MITGIWVSGNREEMAVQLDGEQIFITDFSEAVARVREVGELDGTWQTLLDEGV
jgi:hypothetical protein